MHEAKNLVVWCIVVLIATYFHFVLDPSLLFNRYYLCMGAYRLLAVVNSCVYIKLWKMYTVRPQTVITPVFLGNVLSWTNTLTSVGISTWLKSNGVWIMMRKAIHVAVSPLEPLKLGASWSRHITIAERAPLTLLIPTHGNLSFVFMLAELLALLHLGLTFPDFPLGIRFCSQFPVEMHRALIFLAFLCTLTDNPTSYLDKNMWSFPNFHSCGLSHFSSLGSEMTLDCSLLTKLCLYSKGESIKFLEFWGFFGGAEDQFMKTILFEFPSLWGLSISKSIFWSQWIGQT